MAETKERVLDSKNRHVEFIAAGRLVTMRAREAEGETEDRGLRIEDRAEICAPEILAIDEVAGQAIDGIDSKAILSRMADIGPEARLFLYRPQGKAVRAEVFEDPRICPEINRGAVIENLKEKPKDVSGWRTHDFIIDTKGCLGDECGRCAVMCPENAIHLMGKGKGSFHEIDPLACKGCYICWVECYRTAADCILVDGKTFDAAMRAKHFGE